MIKKKATGSQQDGRIYVRIPMYQRTKVGTYSRYDCWCRKLWRFRSCRSWVRGALFDSGYRFCVSKARLLEKILVKWYTGLLRSHLVLLFFFMC